ncbi:C2 domain-containing protein [Aureococcus anophagefferens]|nr:C2 domain-containing protein [Aureococcus anophagefferens]
MASLVDNMDGLAVADAVVVAGGVSGTVAGTSAEHMMNPGTLEIEVIQGRDLVIKDRGTFRSNKSDPFCVVAVDGAKVGKTKTVDRNLSPSGTSAAAKVKRGAQKRLVVNCFDKDKLSSSDPMGTVVIEVLEALRGADVATRVRRWYDVNNCEGCDNARGQIEIAFAWKPKTVIALEKGTPFRVEHPEQALFCFDGAALHSGDALTGDEAAAERTRTSASSSAWRGSRAVASMLFVVTAYAEKSSFVDMKSAFVGLFDPVEGEMCRYAFDCRGDHGPRHAYLSDLVSHVRVGDPNDRVAIMHKGSVVDLSYYQAGPLAEVRMGVAWDITGGRSIDLDASCLLLKAGCSEATTEIVSYQKLSSSAAACATRATTRRATAAATTTRHVVARAASSGGATDDAGHPDDVER